MAPSNTKCIRNTALVLVIAFFVLLFPEVVFASASLTIQIDPANQADVYIRDDTTGQTIVYKNAQSPFSYPGVVAGHTYTVWVKKNGYNLLVKHWPDNPLVPNDWDVNATGDEATGPVQNGAKSVHFNSDGIDLSVTKQCHDLIAGQQSVLAYTIVVTHLSGWNNADQVTLTDDLPSGLTSAVYTVDGTSMGSWPTSNQIVLSAVAPGTSHTIEIYASVDLSVTSITMNTVTISSVEDLNTSNDTDSCMNNFTPKGMIIVQKVTDPSGDQTSFGFSGDLGSFILNGDGASEQFLVAPGTYTVSENMLTGWVLSSIAGDNNGDPSDGVTITVAAGETKAVTFNNTKVGGYVTITPGSATNEVGMPHEFSVTGYAEGAAPTSWSMTPTVTPAPDTQSVTSPVVAGDGMSATWKVTINNSDPEQFTASASVTMTFAGGTTVTVETNGTGGSSGPATKDYTYQQAKITLDPLSKTNEVGDTHTVTATVKVRVLDATGNPIWEDAPNGTQVTFSGSATFTSATTVGTSGGTASVTLRETTPGTVTIHAEATIVNPASADLVVKTDGSGGSSGDAQKTYEYQQAKITLDPLSKTNEVGDTHTVTATVKVRVLDATGNPIWEDAPNGTQVTFSGSATFTSATTVGTSGGTASVTLRETTPGTVTIHAEATIVNPASADLVVKTDGSGGSSGDAQKTYEYQQAKITLDPLSKTNEVGDTHTVTATVKVRVLDATGNPIWEDAPNGTQVTFSGSATFTSATTVGTSGGTASVTLRETTPGTVTIHAEATIVNPASADLVVKTDGSGGSSGDAQKTYEYQQAKITLDPLSKTNEVGDTHTVTATVKVRVLDATGNPIWEDAPNGTQVTFSGSATFTSATTVGTSGGTASVTLRETTPGTVTIHAEATIVNPASADLVVKTDGSGGSSGDAQKTYEYQQAKITLDPLSKTNEVGDTHTVTATVKVRVLDATGNPIWEDAPNGTQVTFSGSATFTSATTVGTSGGTASVTLRETTPGTVTIHAEATIVNPASADLVVKTDGSGGSSGDAQKTYEYQQAKITLDPLSKTNEVGDTHTVTATVKVRVLDATGNPIWEDAPNGTQVTFSGSATFTSATTVGTSGGTASVTLRETTPGTVTIHAEATIVNPASADLVVKTDGSGGSSGDAQKTYEYQQAKITLDPLSKTNEVGDTHTVTATVKVRVLDATGNPIWEDAPNGTQVTFSGSATFTSATTVGTSGGTASVTLRETTPGTVTIHAEATIVNPASADLVVKTDGSGGSSGDAQKTYEYQQAKITLDPLSKTNEVGDTHTVTATVKVRVLDATGNPIWEDAPNGTQVTFSGSATFTSATTVGTSGGTASVTLRETTPGTVTIHAEATIVNPASADLVVKTDGSGGSSGDAQKTYEYQQAKITLDPLSKTNEVGDTHTVTATVKVRVLDATGNPIWEDAPNGTQVTFSGSATFTSATTVGTSGGTASVTLRETTPGTVTIHAEATIVNPASADLVVKTDGSGGSSGDAQKTYEYQQAKITLDPLSKTNEVGDTHTVTATVKVRVLDATGNPIWEDAPNGTQVTFSGSATFTSATTVGTSGGTASVTLRETTPGTVTIHAEATIVNPASADLVVKTDGSGGSSGDAQKTYEYQQAKITLDPLSKTNEVGDTHTVTATVKVRVLDATGNPIWEDAPNGTQVTFSGSATFTSATTVGTSGGTASVTLRETTPGTVTIHAEATIVNPASADLVVKTDGSGGSSGDAQKTYVDATITLDPLTATNEVESPHTFYALVKVNDGAGWSAISGATVVFTRENNNAGATIVDSDTTTDANGQAWVKINSSAPGSVEIHASTTVEVGGITLARATDGTGQNSGNAKKIYVTTGIKIEKSTNGEDADTVTGPLIPTGLLVNWTYTVTNTGDIPISNVQVSDDNGTPGNSGDDFSPTGPSGDNGNGLLYPSEIWTYTAQGIAVVGQYENIGRVTGEDSLGGDLTDSDFSHYFGAAPGIAIEKVADKATVSAVGEVINYTITVDNTGNVDLTNVVLGDVFAGGATLDSGDANSNSILETTETWIYKASYTVTQADINAGTDLVNVATVDTDQTDEQQDDATTTITQGAALTIEKVADKATVSAVGEVINYTITVDNTGNVDLTNVVLGDVFAGGATLDSGDANSNSILETTETWIYKASYTVTQVDINAGTALVNVATVDTDQTDEQQDDATTTITQGAALTIDKVADKATVSAVGQVINYTITVDNTGNVDLTNVVLGDVFAGGATLDSGDANSNSILETTETWIYKASYTVTQVDINAGTALVNVATVDTDQTDEQQDDATTTITQGAALTIDKVADKATVSAVGQVINYTITVDNTGNVDLTNVVLGDVFAGGATLDSGDANSNSILETTETWIYKASYTVTQADINAGTDLVNVATVDTDQTDEQQDDATTTITQGAALTIDKVADKATVSAVGQVINYTITVDNTGNVDLTNVVLGDVFAGGATLDSGDANSNSILETTETWIYKASYTVTQVDINVGTALVNVATVDTDQTDEQQDDATTTITQGAALTIDKVADKATVSAVGQVINYTITVDNTGNVDLTNVVLGDVFAGGATLDSGDANSNSILETTETWIYKASYTVTQVDINAGTDLVNVATVDTDQTDEQQDDATTTITQGPSIEIEKSTNGQDADSAPGPNIAVGDTVTWTYAVTNTGDVTLTNIVVTDSDLGAVGTIVSLAPGASQTLTKTGTAVTGQYTNTGTATVSHGGPTYSDSDDSHYFGGNPSIAIEKTPDTQQVISGTDAMFHIRVENTGDVPLTNVVISDILAPNCASVTIGTLAVGAVYEYDCVTPNVTTSFVNEAIVTGEDPSGNPVTDTDTARVVIITSSISVVKEADVTTANVGDTVTYTYRVTNTGDGTLSNITLVDDKLGAISVGATTLEPGESVTVIANYTVQMTDLPGPVLNVATATGTDPANNTVTDEAQETVDIIAGEGGTTEDACEGRVIINEVAWAGTAADSRDEWIELRNLGTIPVDLTGWTLRWRRKHPTTEEEYRWKVVNLSGILLPASTSACELADKDPTPSIEFIKRDTDDLSWWVLGKHKEEDGSYYTIERRHDETISNEKADLLYDTTEPYEMDLTDLGDVIQLINDRGEVVDTANASNPEQDGWPAGSVATFATMERTNPLAPDTWENWHTNLGIITRGLDAQEQPLIATADALNSKELEELALNAELPPAKTRAGARLEVGLDLLREDRIALGWPWIRVTRPDLAEVAGGGGAVEAGAGVSFSGRYSGDLYWLGIDTGGLLPGQYNIWIVYGEGKAILVPILVLP